MSMIVPFKNKSKKEKKKKNNPQTKQKQADYSESGDESINTRTKSCKSDDAQVCGSVRFEISYVFCFVLFFFCNFCIFAYARLLPEN